MTVPFFELSSTRTEPPWMSAISHTSERPSPAFEKKKNKKYETVFGTFTYRNVPSEAFPLGIRLIQEGSRICGYNGA